MKTIPMTLFAAASLAPLPLFAAGLWLGGPWVLAVFLYMTAFAALMDQALPFVAGDAEEGSEFPAADALLVALAIGHLAAFPTVVWAIAGESGLGFWEKAGLFLGAGLWFGQVSNPMAHELIHRGNRWLFRLGALVYVSMLFGHHTSAHRHVHHRYAASADDPNTARSGEGFYPFFLRAWTGSFMQGMKMENARGHAIHPYVWYMGGGAAALALGHALGGAGGVLVWLALALHAQVQLMLSDYVQHYGLQRARRADGKLEPVGPRHSWNAPHWFSSAMMLNAPRHSDHHAHPARPYPSLRLPAAADAPMLPWPLPMACTLALIPPLWKRAMRPHLRPWRQAAVTPN
ncbi:MAG: alkane 1-monooxygenase [Rhodobacteraceae bacterium]|nr:alkane 1-monooxygenase [Paracoccaceae bacterium]